MQVQLVSQSEKRTKTHFNFKINASNYIKGRKNENRLINLNVDFSFFDSLISLKDEKRDKNTKFNMRVFFFFFFCKLK